MTFRPKLVALDVDGTLVDERNAISPATADAVRRLVDAGIPVVISTGRAVPTQSDVPLPRWDGQGLFEQAVVDVPADRLFSAEAVP